MKKENVLIGQADQKSIDAWKEQHKNGIYAVESDGHIGYFKKPSRHEMNCAMSKADTDAALAMFEELANITYLGGSDAILTDDDKFLGLVQELKVVMDGTKAKMVNL